jgi:alpha-glucosidase (family GH31 glycosyl hydrolase)
MIQHHPHGIDDPYQRLATERLPRDPSTLDEVQINFQCKAKRAWVVLESSTGKQNFEARAWQGNIWTVFLGKLEFGSYQYWIHADNEVAGPFALEVSRWLSAEKVESVNHDEHSVTVALSTIQRPKPISLTFGFPLPGVCRYEFAAATPKVAKGLPCRVSRDENILSISADGVEVQLDFNTLDIRARHSGQDFVFHGSARLRWLETKAGLVTRLESSFTTQPDEWLYGLGERFTGPNLKGQTWDTRVYEEYKEQNKRTYLPIPFIVSTKNYGLYLDANEPSLFDLTGNNHMISLAKLPAEDVTLAFNIILAERAYNVTSIFTKLTGNIEVPPKWAFGPWMSANTWNTQAKAETAIRRTIQEDVPATVLVLEAWSDESTFYIFNDANYEPKAGSHSPSLSDFTFTGRWANPKALIDECHQHGIRVLLWQIPVHKKLDEAHAQHDADKAHMLGQGFYIQNEDGTPYECKGWWFNGALIPDFTNPQARAWWFSKRKYLFEDLGIDGMKTDGGEHIYGRELRSSDGSRGLELVNTFANHYISAYHTFIQQHTNNNGLTFSRAGYTGAQRFPAHWAGDENSTWNAFRASVLAGLSAGLAGISMWAWDIAGFSGEIPTVELYTRATAMACFCPIMQYHSEPSVVTENRERTPWNISERHNDPRALSIYRFYAKLRMRLLDYIYEEARVLSEAGLPLMRYPALEFPEARDFLSRDRYSYLFARDLLVCPVLEKGASAREVYLPPGEWVDLWSGSHFEGSRVIVAPAPLELIPVFVRADSPRISQLLGLAKE